MNFKEYFLSTQNEITLKGVNDMVVTEPTHVFPSRGLGNTDTSYYTFRFQLEEQNYYVMIENENFNFIFKNMFDSGYSHKLYYPLEKLLSQENYGSIISNISFKTEESGYQLTGTNKNPSLVYSKILSCIKYVKQKHDPVAFKFKGTNPSQNIMYQKFYTSLLRPMGFIKIEDIYVKKDFIDDLKISLSHTSNDPLFFDIEKEITNLNKNSTDIKSLIQQKKELKNAILQGSNKLAPPPQTIDFEMGD